MKQSNPCISLMIFTYNRAHLLERTVDSVLNQTFQDFEIILVNNASEDNTAELLKKYKDHPKIRQFHFEKNRGYIGAFNFGLSQIRGEWFSELGDDDFLEPHAFETLLEVPKTIDATINAVTCNGFDTATQTLSGIGLDKDQYLKLAAIIQKCGGDFWGITKTSLLGNKKLNKKLRGLENTFWYKIDAEANRYYIHQQLMTYDTAHDIRETGAQHSFDLSQKAVFYQELLNEDFYWQVVKQHHPKEYIRKCIRGLLFTQIEGKRNAVKKYWALLKQIKLPVKQQVISQVIGITPPPLLKSSFLLLNRLK